MKIHFETLIAKSFKTARSAPGIAGDIVSLK